MKIDSLNDPDPKIVRMAQKINEQYFNDVNVSAGLYQSKKHETFRSLVGKKISCVIPDEDASVLAEQNVELRDIVKYFIKSINSIIWFGKFVHQKKATDLKHIVAHELKHVEQKYLNPETFNKDRLLDCSVFPALKIEPPIEKDADNFADRIVGRDVNCDYSWRDDVEKFFDKYKQKIEELHGMIKRKEAPIIELEPGVGVFLKPQHCLRFCHFYEKVYKT